MEKEKSTWDLGKIGVQILTPSSTRWVTSANDLLWLSHSFLNFQNWYNIKYLGYINLHYYWLWETETQCKWFKQHSLFFSHIKVLRWKIQSCSTMFSDTQAHLTALHPSSVALAFVVQECDLKWQTSLLCSSKQDGGRNKKRHRACTIVFWGKLPAAAVQHFCLYHIVKALVTWPHLAAREAEKFQAALCKAKNWEPC